MSDLDSYVDERKKRDKGFAEGFDEGYEQFKIGEVLRQIPPGSHLEDMLHRKSGSKPQQMTGL